MNKIKQGNNILETPDLEAAIEDYSQGGLTSDQAKAKLEQFGGNSFIIEKTKGWKSFCKQFINPFSFILIFASTLSAYMGEYTDTIVIMSIVLLNSCLSFVQEFRSGKAAKNSPS